jgi:hypothetical protein
MTRPCSRRLFTLAALAAALLPFAGCTHSDQPYQGLTTEAVAVADLDLDGATDILSATSVFDETAFQPGYLTVRRQSALDPGTFAAPIRTTTCLDPEALALGDLDGDGRLDVAVACGATGGAGFEVALHLQDPGQPGRFGPSTLLSTGTAQPTAVRLVDLDGDGRLDLVVGARTGTGLLLFFQQPSPSAPGTFEAPVTLDVGAPPVALAAGDLTGAGRLDLVAATADGRVVVLLHDTAPGTFLSGLSAPAGLYPVAVEIADLDGDGHPDLLLADASGSLLVMTQRAGGGAFDPVVAHDLFDWNTRALSVADLDGDGRLDVAVASAGPPGLPGSVAVFLQAPAPALAGTLLTPTLYTGYQGPVSIAAADVDGDGLVDLVIADGLASIRYQDADGHFLPPVWLRQ